MKSKITERETATFLKIDAIVSVIVRKLPFNVVKIFRYNIRTIFIVFRVCYIRAYARVYVYVACTSICYVGSFSHFETRAIGLRCGTSTFFNFLMDTCDSYTLLSRDHSAGLIENCGCKTHQEIDTLTEPFGNIYYLYRNGNFDITEHMITSRSENL